MSTNVSEGVSGFLKVLKECSGGSMVVTCVVYLTLLIVTRDRHTWFAEGWLTGVIGFDHGSG